MRYKPVLAGLTLLAIAHTAQAQHPIVTQNADEPGRVPYQAYKTAPCTGGVSFNDVPAGKRLVLTFASGFFVAQSGSEFVSVDTFNADFTDYTSRIFLPFAPTIAELSGRQFAGPIEAYVDAGATVRITLGGCVGGSYASATLAGYFVTAP